jgi:hypothetical protein
MNVYPVTGPGHAGMVQYGLPVIGREAAEDTDGYRAIGDDQYIYQVKKLRAVAENFLQQPFLYENGKTIF